MMEIYFADSSLFREEIKNQVSIFDCAIQASGLKVRKGRNLPGLLLEEGRRRMPI
ncbi:MAG: hypothetical protein HZA16_03835 [Nitrospirae bacterium]|nr:hypothetical protein [Nitrospirota bacterium]